MPESVSGQSPSKSVFERQLEVLTKEWDHVQVHIGRFDTIVFGIRGWAVSAFTALFAVAITQKLPSLMLFGVATVFLFWLLEALHKGFQRRFIRRCRVIEKYLASQRFLTDAAAQRKLSIRVPHSSEQFGRDPLRVRVKYVFKNAFIANVWATYIALSGLCVASFIVLLALGELEAIPVVRSITSVEPGRATRDATRTVVEPPKLAPDAGQSE